LTHLSVSLFAFSIYQLSQIKIAMTWIFSTKTKH